MAITRTGLANLGLQIKLGVLALVVGAGLAMWAGWTYEKSNLGQGEQEHATRHAIGYFLSETGLAEAVKMQASPIMRDYTWLASTYPKSAKNIRNAMRRAFLYPWPILGALMALGILIYISNFIGKGAAK